MPSLLRHALVSTSTSRAFGGLALMLAAQAWAFWPPNCPPVPGLPQATSTLTVNISGSGQGRVVSVTPFQNFIDCGSGGSDCSESFTPAATLPFLLRAQPNAGSRFLGWSGGGCGGPVDCPVSVVRDMTVTASFGPAQQTLPGTPVNQRGQVRVFVNQRGQVRVFAKGKRGLVRIEISCGESSLPE